MRILLTILSAMWLFCASAQEDRGVQLCTNAEKAYKIGRFEEAQQMLNVNLDTLSTRAKVEALRVLTLCSIAQDRMQEAELYASRLVGVSPYFTAGISDPMRFIDMIERIKAGRSNTITTASQQAESIDEAPVPVTLITEDMIKSSGARNLRELLLTYVPGITAIEGEESNVSMRGMYYGYAQEHILIMRNGHRMNSYATNAIAPDYRISLNNIKQIEVLRGPASSLYGNVALTAVVNIITKSGGDVDGLSMSYGFGDNTTHKAELLLGKKYYDSDLLLWASLYTSKGYKYNIGAGSDDFYGIVPHDGYLYVDGYNNKPSMDLGLRYMWNGFTFSLSHQYSKRVQSYNSIYFFSVYDYDRYGTFDGKKPGRGVSSTNANIDYVKALGSNNTLSASVSLNFESADLYNVLGDSLPGPYGNFGAFIKPVNEYLKDSLVMSSGAFCMQGWRNLNFEGELRFNRKYKIGRQNGTILVGAQYDYFNSYYNYISLGSNYENIIMTAVDDKSAIYKNGIENSLSFYGQIKHYFSPSIIFNGGLRYDYKHRFNDMDINVFSPRFSLIYLPNNVWNLKASYAHSYVDPSFFYRVSMILYLGNPDLKPQHMDSYQISGNVNIAPLRLTYGGNVFYNHSTDVMAMNIGSQRESAVLDMMGFENTLTFNIPHFTANANILYQKIVYSKNYTTYDNHVNAVPEFTVHINADKELDFLLKGLWLGANMSYTSKQVGQTAGSFINVGNESKANQPYELPASCILDAGLRYNSSWGSFSFRCYNLFDTTYRLGGQRAPILQSGRNVLASLTLFIK